MKEVVMDLFWQNEKAFRAKQYTCVLDDEQIRQAIQVAFPKRNTANMKNILQWRRAYNNGYLMPEGAKPVFRSHRYIRDVDGTVIRVTARGTPIGRHDQ